jgi:hypothetical protein
VYPVIAALKRCATQKRLSLPLLVFGVDADHPHYSLAVDDLALVANLLN